MRCRCPLCMTSLLSCPSDVRGTMAILLFFFPSSLSSRVMLKESTWSFTSPLCQYVFSSFFVLTHCIWITLVLPGLATCGEGGV